MGYNPSPCALIVVGRSVLRGVSAFWCYRSPAAPDVGWEGFGFFFCPALGRLKHRRDRYILEIRQTSLLID